MNHQDTDVPANQIPTEQQPLHPTPGQQPTNYITQAEQTISVPPDQQPPNVQQHTSSISREEQVDVSSDQEPANVSSAQQSRIKVPLHNLSTNVSGEETWGRTEDHELQNGAEKENSQENIPKFNCPEKIVLCFDLSSELNSVVFRHNQENGRSVFQIIKGSMKLFVKHKLTLSKKHEIAIVTLDQDVLWVQDFSSDVDLITDTIDNINTNTVDPLQECDMTSLLETIANHVEMPELGNVDVPPEYVVRVIMIYGRSHSDLPNFSGQGKLVFHRYMSSPFFFFDVLYVHEHPDEDNKCEDIYDTFCKLDETEDCFVLEVSRVAARIYEHTAQLLAHPLQRPKQQDIDYRVVEDDGSDEEHEAE